MLFTIKHLQSRLKKEGLPHSHKTIAKYERKGLIQRASGIDYGGGAYRTYSEQEIEYIVSAFRNRKKGE